MNDPSLADRLAQGLLDLGIALDRATQERLLAYVALLDKWNHAYNLTAVRAPSDMVTRHLLDSLSILPYVRGPRVLDVGTGPGLPGIPMALALPGVHFTLLDSNGKKTRFLRQVVAEIGIENAEITQTRAEKFHPAEKFATLVSRAFASIGDFVRAAGHACAPDGRILAMKGTDPSAELIDLPPGYAIEATYRLTVPGLSAQRHIVIIVPA